MKNTFIFALLLFTVLTPAYANHGYAIDFIRGEGSVNGIKLAYQYNIDQPLDIS